MNSENPLEQLRDIHLPDAISWWPLAPGWWFLIVLAALMIFWLGYKLRKRHQFRATYRYCLAELEKIEQNYLDSNNAHTMVSSYSQLLRRLLILRLGREHVASQTGTQLLATLEQYSLADGLTKEHKALLLDGPYRKQLTISDYGEFKQVIESTLTALSVLRTKEQYHA